MTFCAASPSPHASSTPWYSSAACCWSRCMGSATSGFYGLLGGKLATYAVQNDQGLSYTLYLLTFALDSVGDVFGSVFLIAAGVLVIQSHVLPRWLASIAVISGTLLFVQGFGLGG